MLNLAEKMTDDERIVFDKYKAIFPFPIVKFATEIGIKIFASDEMPDSMSGAISKELDGYVIFLNAKHSSRRMRFTLAHEIAHYFNDKSYLDSNGKIEDSTKQSKKWLFRDTDVMENNDPIMRKMDIKANKFAADLLMPESEFIKKWQEFNSIEDVANYFDVSIDAVRIRAACVMGEIV